MFFKGMQGVVKFDLERLRIDQINFKEAAGKFSFSAEDLKMEESRFYPEHGEVNLTGNYKVGKQFHHKMN